MAAGSIWFVTWYQHDRPLLLIEKTLKERQAPLALQQVKQFLRQSPDDSHALALKARILVEMDQPAEALRIFQRYGASAPADLYAWAKAHLLREEWSDALPVLDRILELNPRDPVALHDITACRAFLGCFRDAFDSVQKLATCAGHEGEAWLQTGSLHKRLGNVKSALEAWQEVLQFNPDAQKLQIRPSEFFREFGRLLLEDGQPERAREMLQRSLALRQSAQAFAILGDAQQQLDDQAGAVESWNRAIKMDPLLISPRESLAQTALREGQLDESRKYLEPILKSPDLTSGVTYLMQRICSAQNDRDSAEEWRQRTDQLRKHEKLHAAMLHTLIESPESYWARAIRAYQFAEAGNWHEAEVLTQTLQAETAQEPFVRSLSNSVRTRGPLPSIELLPLQQF